MNKPNEALAMLIREADDRSGCSWAGLARRINDLAAVEGKPLNYDYTAVHRWVKKGEKPRGPVAGLIARALTEKLGRRIDPADFGMPDEESLARRGLDYPRSAAATVDVVAELGRADVNRRSIVKAPFVLAALAAPSRDWLLATLDATATERGSRRIGLEQVTGIRGMFAVFQEMDVMRGGGHARTALIEYMNSHVVPLLKREHDARTQAALYEAAAEMAYLVGWMTYDDGQGRHGLAQRYLIQALRLAEAAGSTSLGAHILASLSDQANLLGHASEALSLARAGRRGLDAGDSTACLADLHILEARALAALGEASGAAAAVSRAERMFDQVTPENEPEWARFIDRAYLFGEAAHCFRDLKQPDQIERFAKESADAAQSQGRARRGALSQAALALGDLTRGEIEAAAAKSTRAVELSAAVNSSRCVETVRDLQRRLQPFGQVPAVQEFNLKARDLLGLSVRTA